MKSSSRFGHLLHIYVLLHVRNLYSFLIEAAIYLGVESIGDTTT